MTSRECPRDWTSLEPTTLSAVGPDVTVDVCPECHGLFLDHGELLRLTLDKDVYVLLNWELGLDSDSELVCPGCGGLLDREEVPLAGGGTVEIEACLTCKGVWLDAGELEEIEEGDVDLSHLPPEKIDELRRAREAHARMRHELLAATFGGIVRKL